MLNFMSVVYMHEDLDALKTEAEFQDLSDEVKQSKCYAIQKRYK